LRHAKGNLTTALHIGNLTLAARSSEEEAIAALEKAVKRAEQVHLTAGVPEAHDQIERLQRLAAAKQSITAVLHRANATLQDRNVDDRLLETLAHIVSEAEAVGLNEHAAEVQIQLEKLHALKEAHDELAVAMTMAKPDADTTAAQNSTDLEAKVRTFKNDAELHVVNLPPVPGAQDDGDLDFEEHIQRVKRAINKAKEFGVVDPDMLVQLGKLEALESAWDTLSSAMHSAEEAVDSKSNLITAQVKLQAALDEADESGLTAGHHKATRLLSQLKQLPKVRDELEASMIQAVASLKAGDGVEEALIRLTRASDEARTMRMFYRMKNAEALRDQLLLVEQAHSALRAAIVRGTLALRTEVGEDEALQEAAEALAEARRLGVHTDVPAMLELINALEGLSAEHTQQQAAVVAFHHRRDAK
jgi:dihydroorotate dehydrogenase